MEETSNIFTVLPMSQRLFLNPGEDYEGSITIVNPVDATEDFKYKISVYPYGVSGDNYDADLITDTDRTIITKWIEVAEPTGTIKPNESKEIHFTIKVPKNAPGGGQYATIAVSSDTEATAQDGVAVQNVFEIASIIYADVAGETIHEGDILENIVPGFALTTPVKITALLNNSGNIHENAIFTITATNMLNGQSILPTEGNDGRYSEMIMPDTERYVEREISNLPTIGIVKVTQTINYNGQISTAEQQMIICPIWFLTLVVAALGALIATVVLLIKKHHRRRSIV